jgi:hypothetical protein
MARWEDAAGWESVTRGNKSRSTPRPRVNTASSATPAPRANAVATTVEARGSARAQNNKVADDENSESSATAPSQAGAAATSKVADDLQSESSAEPEERAVAVKGIEGTMAKYDVKSTLEGRERDFDRCHDVRGRARSGRITFRIHVLPNGNVGDVRVRQSSVRDRALVDCYSGVIMASKFPSPHGGYADVNWSTKVGRSRARPGDIFERRGRWDAPSESSLSRPSGGRESRGASKSGRRRRGDG